MKKILALLLIVPSICFAHSTSELEHNLEKCCKKTVCLLKDIDNDLEDCCENIQAKLACDHVILAADIGVNGFIISEPGYYCLGENVTYNPAGTNPAIRISANNVTLDLNAHTLSQINKNTLNVVGIVVDPGLTTITLKNGVVQDFSFTGIQAGSLATGSTVLSELKISGISAFNNGIFGSAANPAVAIGFPRMGGITLFNAQDVILENTRMNENFILGLLGDTISKLTMDRCSCDDNKAGFAIFMGVLFVSLEGARFRASPNLNKDFSITNCTFNNNIGPTEVKGLRIDSTTNGFIDSCQFNSNGVIVDDPAFIPLCGDGAPIALGLQILVASSNFQVTNCQANGQFITVNPSPTGAPFTGLIRIGMEAYGFLTSVGTGASNVAFDNCQASGTTITLNTNVSNDPASPDFLFDLIHRHTPQGIRLGGATLNVSVTNSTFSNHRVINNSGAGINATTFGLFSVNSNNIYIENCQSSGNSNTYNAASLPTLTRPSILLVSGFSTNNRATFDNCYASGHTQAAPNLTGIFPSSTGGFNIANTGAVGPVVLRNCIATNNTDTLASGAGSIAAGFSTSFGQSNVRNATNGYVFENCIAEYNTSTSGTEAAGTAGCGFALIGLRDSKIIDCIAEGNNIGILVDNIPASPVIQSTNNLFTGNILSANTLFGIRDKTNNNTNAYYTNRAKNNGPTPATTNFSSLNSILPPATCPPTVATPGTPMRLWILPNPPCNVDNNGERGEILDNISIG